VLTDAVLRFDSTSIDAVNAFMTQIVGSHSRVTHARGPAPFSFLGIGGSEAAAAWVRYGGGMTIRGETPQPTLHLQVPTGTEYRVGRRAYHPEPGEALLLAPGRELTRRSPAGRMMAIAVERSRLFAELGARRPGDRASLSISTRPVRIQVSDRARLRSAANRFAAAMETAAAAKVRSLAETDLINALLEVLLRDQAVRPVRVSATERIARVEDWIEAHLTQPLSVGRLCEAANVGERALQKAFEQRHGMSPMRFVTERRMTAARRVLLTSRDDVQVTDVALQFGFLHAGRFARRYHELFGEWPSQTLRRRSR
jgi:AraC-like DNA-binding protein